MSAQTALIIPIYNGEQYLDRTVSMLAKDCTEMTWVFVDDGSTDGTFEKLQALQSQHKGQAMMLCRHDHNQGKGSAIVTAINALADDVHTYDTVAFTDVELPYGTASLHEAITKLLSHGDLHAVIGERADMQDRYGWYRLTGRWIVRRLLPKAVRHIKDTQCGLKVFRFETLQKLVAKLQTHRWVFDIELLLLLEQNHLGYDTVAVQLAPHIMLGKGGVRFGKNGMRIFRDLRRINHYAAQNYYRL